MRDWTQSQYFHTPATNGNYDLGRALTSFGDQFGAPWHFVVRGFNLFATVPGQAIGLGEDALIDFVKGQTVAHESVCHEGHRGYINPFHSWLPGPFKAPRSICRASTPMAPSTLRGDGE